MGPLPPLLKRGATRLSALPGDERGVTSVMSLVAVLSFTLLLVMLTNVVRHLDDKVRMQNAADAAAYSGGVMLAQGLNAIALSNHLQAETFALLALSRALEDRGSKSVRGLIPLLEFILGPPASGGSGSAVSGLLVAYQRDVVFSAPQWAQEATNEIALRHGLPRGQMPPGGGLLRTAPGTLSGNRGPQWGILWRTTAVAVGREDQSDPLARTLPIVDPNADSTDLAFLPEAARWRSRAAVRRLEVASLSLRQWVDEITQTGRRRDPTLLGDATRYLLQLHERQYPASNLPFLLRSRDGNEGFVDNPSLLNDFSFLGVAYRKFDQEHGPVLFKNPLAATSDAMAFAQVSLFLPKARYRCCPWETETDSQAQEWNSFNQTWGARLVPADAESALTVLRTAPPYPADGFRPSSWAGVQPIDFERVNTH